MSALEDAINRILRNYLSSKSVATIKSAKVVSVGNNNMVVVKITDENNNIEVINKSGAVLFVGDNVKVCYTGLSPQPNKTFVISGGNNFNVKNVMADSVAELANDEIQVFDINCECKGTIDCVLYCNVNLYNDGASASDITVKIFKDEVEQSYNTVDTIGIGENKNINVSLPMTLSNGNHNIKIKVLGDATLVSGLSFINGIGITKREEGE